MSTVSLACQIKQSKKRLKHSEWNRQKFYPQPSTLNPRACDFHEERDKCWRKNCCKEFRRNAVPGFQESNLIPEFFKENEFLRKIDLARSCAALTDRCDRGGTDRRPRHGQQHGRLWVRAARAAMGWRYHWHALSARRGWRWRRRWNSLPEERYRRLLRS